MLLMISLCLQKSLTCESPTALFPRWFIPFKLTLRLSCFSPQPLYTLHLRTLSTNSSHPETSRSILQRVLDRDIEFHHVFVQVAGDHIGVLSYTPNSRSGDPSLFDLWNWRTGIHQHVRYPYENKTWQCRLNSDQVASDDSSWNSFIFLNSSTLLFPAAGKVPSHGSALDMYAISENGCSIRRTASFLLPGLLKSTIVQASFENRRASVQANNGRNHVCDPNQSVIVIQLIGVSIIHYHFTLVVEKAALLSDVHPYPDVISAAPMIVPWHNWSRRARMFPSYSFYLACVHGTRCLTITAGNGFPTLEVYDFNTRRRPIQLDRDDVAMNGHRTVTVVEESSIQSEAFTHPVRTSLPYHRVSTGPGISGWASIVMDENYIVGITSRVANEVSPSY